MMQREHISNRQFTIILFLMRTTVVIAFLPVLTAADAGRDAWISSIITFFGTLLLGLFIILPGTIFPRQSIAGYSQFLLGPYLGKLLVLPVLWAFLHLSSLEIRIYADVIVAGFLSETPLLFVMGGMVLVASLAAIAGLEVIGRCAEIIFAFFLVMLLFSILAAVPQVEIENLQPVLARGWEPVLTGAITPVFLGAQLLVMTFLLPALQEPKKAIASMVWAVGGASIALLLVALVVIGALGAEQGARSIFPFIKLMRAAQVSEFLERVEPLIVFAWGFGLFIAVSTYLYCGARGIAQIFNLQDYRPLIPPMAVIWVTLGQEMSEDVLDFRSFIEPEIFAPYAGLFLLSPLVIIWIVWGIRKITGRI